MKKDIFILDNYKEFQFLKDNSIFQNNSKLILLSSSFNKNIFNDQQFSSVVFYDSNIFKTNINIKLKEIYHIIWEWFIDHDNKDISIIDNLSLGRAFLNSVELLTISAFRYYYGLKKQLNKFDRVTLFKNTEPVFLEVISILKDELCLTINEIDLQIDSSIKYKNLEIDLFGRKRDIPQFVENKFTHNLLYKIDKFVNSKKKFNKNIIFFPSGKMEEYFCSQNLNGIGGFKWTIPYTSKKELIGIKKHSHYQFYIGGQENLSKKNIKKINKIKTNLIKNLHKNKTIKFNKVLLIKLFSKFIFKYFEGAFSYFLKSKNIYKTFMPELVIFSSDSHENNILAAQAAKLFNIKTVLTAHGYTGRGHKKFRKGKLALFDYAIGFGKLDKENYIFSGFNKDKVFISPLPYFGKFLKNKKDIIRNQKNVLILLPDFSISLCEKLKFHNNYLDELVKKLEEKKINIIGIKARYDFQFEYFHTHENKIIINGKKYNCYSGYSNFNYVLRDADFVIGPLSTAFLEANMLGKNYYPYMAHPFHLDSNTDYPNIEKIINISYSIKELLTNIDKRSSFKKGSSIKDILEISKSDNQYHINKKFEKIILEILNH